MNELQINAVKSRLNGLSESRMDKSINIIELLVSNGQNPQDIFPLGIPSNPDDMDKAVIRFIRKPGEEHQTLIDFINSNNDISVIDRRIFTQGIVIEDLVSTEITVNLGN